MSSFSVKHHGKIQVRSKLGPIRIELLDQRLNRHAIGFGELRANVPAGLYALQYSAGTAHYEEILRVDPNRMVTREIELPFPAVAPISISTTAHEFHTGPAQQLSQQLKQNYGAGGGLMVFVRTIDADGRAAVPIEKLALHDAELQPVGNLGADAERNPNEGWACLSAQVNPGGYVLRWSPLETTQRSRSGVEPKSVDQALWVSAGWLTIVFIGHRSESGRFERQGTSIHMARLGAGFQPGPSMWDIRENRATAWELKEARINQALDLALGGLRTGDQVVPDDLLDLLLGGKFQNPMLGIIGAHAILQRRTRDWRTFDLVVENLENLIPAHTDVAALRLCGRLIRNQESHIQEAPLNWPPMLCAGYKGLIESDWKASGSLIVDESVAERAAAALLPESPWTCWLALEPPAPQLRAKLNFSLPSVSRFIQEAADPETAPGRIVRELALNKAPAQEFSLRSDLPDMAVQRVSRHIARLNEPEEESVSFSLDNFRELGLPMAAVERAVQALMDKRDVEGHERGRPSGRGSPRIPGRCGGPRGPRRSRPRALVANGRAEMSSEVIVEGDTREDTQDLFDLLLTSQTTLQQQGLSFRGTTTSGQLLGAGIPEVTQLVVALGSAGAFVALAEVLKAYFARRPKGGFTVSTRRGKQSVRVVAESMDSEAMAKAIAAILQRK